MFQKHQVDSMEKNNINNTYITLFINTPPFKTMQHLHLSAASFPSKGFCKELLNSMYVVETLIICMQLRNAAFQSRRKNYIFHRDSFLSAIYDA